MNLEQWAFKWDVRPGALDDLARLLAAPTVTEPQPAPTGSEAAVQQDLRLAAPHLGCLLFRNNVGVATDARGVPVRFGLCNESSRVNSRIKSSDLVGCTKDGKFLAVEVKRPGWTYKGTDREVAQLRFLNLIRAKGGVGLFASSVTDLERGV